MCGDRNHLELKFDVLREVGLAIVVHGECVEDPVDAQKHTAETVATVRCEEVLSNRETGPKKSAVKLTVD